MAAKRKSVAELAREHGIPAQTVYNRTSRGWKLKKALTTPVANTGRKKASNAMPRSSVSAFTFRSEYHARAGDEEEGSGIFAFAAPDAGGFAERALVMDAEIG